MWAACVVLALSNAAFGFNMSDNNSVNNHTVCDTYKKDPTLKRRHKDMHMTASKKNITEVLKCFNASYMFNYNYTYN